MSQRKQLTKAAPLYLKFTEKDGYAFVVKITEGPQHLIDRRVTIPLTYKQLEQINNFEFTEDSCSLSF